MVSRRLPQPARPGVHRDQADRVYVQHKMLDHGADVWRWLDDGGHFYVCGDATRMAKDVDAALTTIIETHGGMSHEAGSRLQARTRRRETLCPRRVLRPRSAYCPIAVARRWIGVRSHLAEVRFLDNGGFMRRRVFLAGGAGAVVAVSAQSVAGCSSSTDEPPGRGEQSPQTKRPGCTRSIRTSTPTMSTMRSRRFFRTASSMANVPFCR